MHRFFTRWRKQGLIGEFHDRLRAATREAEGRDAEPTAGVIDSQSAKGTSTVTAATSGYDGGKKIKGRKRHIVVDTLGLILAVLVTPASTGDRNAARDGPHPRSVNTRCPAPGGNFTGDETAPVALVDLGECPGVGGGVLFGSRLAG
ncbi:transposase [Streptomyces sp. JNUCC 63]